VKVATALLNSTEDIVLMTFSPYEFGVSAWTEVQEIGASWLHLIDGGSRSIG
jgi:hypothetical protein